MGFSWSEVTIPSTAGANFRDFVWDSGHGVLVGVGSSGLVYTTPDAATWTSRTAAEANNWTGVAYAPTLGSSGRLVAVSSAGTHRVMYSDDGGVTWTTASAAAANTWESVAWAPALSLFAAVSGTGTNRVMTSPDGITWTSRSAASAQGWLGICWSATLGLFAAVSNNSTSSSPGSSGIIMTSPDGTTWTQRATPANTRGGGGVGYGSSAIVWSDDAGLFGFSSIDNSGSDRHVTTSPDGSTWTKQTLTNPTDGNAGLVSLSGVGFVQFRDAITSSPPDHVETSADGSSWSDLDTGFDETYDCAGTIDSLGIVCAWCQTSNTTMLVGTWTGPLAISPTTGFTSGGLDVSITGGDGNFAVGTTVRFGRYYGQLVDATNVTVLTGVHLTCSTPPFPVAEIVSVIITNPAADPVGIVDGFTYVVPSTTAGASGSVSVSPDSGPTTGGTVVTITAVDHVFGVSPRVTFDGLEATSVSGGGTDTLTCTTPAHVQGAVDVVVYDA